MWKRRAQRGEYPREVPLRRKVVAPVVQERHVHVRASGHLPEQSSYLLDRPGRVHRPARVCVPDLLQAERRGIAVPAPLVHRDHLAPVGRAPPVLQAGTVDVVAVSPGVDEGVDPRAAEKLRHLSRMTERVGHVPHLLRAPDLRGHRMTVQQVADVRLLPDQELVREHIPRAHGQRARTHQRGDAAPVTGDDGQVVLQDHRLAVEHEATEGVAGFQRVEDLTDHGHERDAEVVERAVPLAVPVGVRDDHQVPAGCAHGSSLSPGRPAPARRPR